MGPAPVRTFPLDRSTGAPPGPRRADERVRAPEAGHLAACWNVVLESARALPVSS
jgi:hypothetical protein